MCFSSGYNRKVLSCPVPRVQHLVVNFQSLAGAQTQRKVVTQVRGKILSGRAGTANSKKNTQKWHILDLVHPILISYYLKLVDNILFSLN